MFIRISVSLKLIKLLSSGLNQTKGNLPIIPCKLDVTIASKLWAVATEQVKSEDGEPDWEKWEIEVP